MSEKIKSYQAFKEELNQLEEVARIRIKRKYTEKYPEIYVGKKAPVRETILQFIDNKGYVTKEELKEFIAAMNEEKGTKTTWDWVRKNSRYIKETRKGFTLTKLGKKVLEKSEIYE